MKNLLLIFVFIVGIISGIGLMHSMLGAKTPVESMLFLLADISFALGTYAFLILVWPKKKAIFKIVTLNKNATYIKVTPEVPGYGGWILLPPGEKAAINDHVKIEYQWLLKPRILPLEEWF